MPKNIVIIGLPRSGTSMSAFIFARQGYFVTGNSSTELRAGDMHNPSGYLEAETLIKLNAEVLAAADYPHDNTWLYAPISKDQASAIAEVSPSSEHNQFVQHYNNNGPWLWKDPRLCYTLDYWWPMLDKHNTRVLLIKRNPEEIYQSFIRLKWRKNSHASKLDVYQRVSDHITAAEAAIEKHNIPHLVINYSDYKQKPAEVARQFNQAFELNLGVQDLNYSKKLNHSSLRGRLATRIDLCLDWLPSPLMRGLKVLVPDWLMRAVYPERFQ